VNKNSWNALPQDLQGIVTSAASTMFREMWKEQFVDEMQSRKREAGYLCKPFSTDAIRKPAENLTEEHIQKPVHRCRHTDDQRRSAKAGGKESHPQCDAGSAHIHQQGRNVYEILSKRHQY